VHFVKMLYWDCPSTTTTPGPVFPAPPCWSCLIALVSGCTFAWSSYWCNRAIYGGRRNIDVHMLRCPGTKYYGNYQELQLAGGERAPFPEAAPSPSGAAPVLVSVVNGSLSARPDEGACGMKLVWSDEAHQSLHPSRAKRPWTISHFIQTPTPSWLLFRDISIYLVVVEEARVVIRSLKPLKRRYRGITEEKLQRELPLSTEHRIDSGLKWNVECVSLRKKNTDTQFYIAGRPRLVRRFGRCALPPDKKGGENVVAPVPVDGSFSLKVGIWTGHTRS